jgi:Uma2 family endonuclease
MVATLISTVQQQSTMTITWESLPEDFILEEEPVENTAQPLIAGALRESLELIGYIEPTMLIASNLGICATMNGNLVIKAPDWFYVKTVLPLPDATLVDRRSYTPNLEGEIPQVVMEFLSETDGKEYSAKRAFPPGKWFFYEQILQVPTYVIFDSADGVLEVHKRSQGQYELQPTDENNRYWIADMGLFLGVWQGEKEGRKGYWLRWWDQAGNLLPWAVELLEQERQRTQQERQRTQQEQQRAEQEWQRAEQERQRAEQERQRAEQERQRAERMAEQLRTLGIFPSD